LEKVKVGEKAATLNKVKVDFAHLLDILDEKSRAILWHLWWHRHAEISELRNLIDASSDFEVLQRLKEVINGKARELWRKPVVAFKESSIDLVSGDKVLFSWWFLEEEDVPVSTGGRPLVDVLNEKDNVVVIVQLPTSANLAQTDLQLKHGILKITFGKKENNGTGRGKERK